MFLVSALLGLLLAASAAEPGVPATADTPPMREVGALRLSDIPELDAGIVEALRPWQAIRSASFQGFAAQGQGVYITTRFAETAQLHHVATPGGARQQLTFDAEPIASVAPHPTDPDLVAIARDRGGNEAWQVELLNRRTGERTLITDGTSRHEGFVWSPDGARFAFFGTGRNGTDFDLYLGDTAAPTQARLALENQGSWRLTDWGPGPGQVVLSQYESITRSALYVVDLATRERRRLTPEGEVAARGGKLSPDGRTLYLTSDHQGEFQTLYALDLATDTWRALSADLPWDVLVRTRHCTRMCPLWAPRPGRDVHSFIPQHPLLHPSHSVAWGHRRGTVGDTHRACGRFAVDQGNDSCGPRHATPQPRRPGCQSRACRRTGSKALRDTGHRSPALWEASKGRTT